MGTVPRFFDVRLQRTTKGDIPEQLNSTDTES